MPLINDVSEWYKIKMPRLEDTHFVDFFETADRLRARYGDEILFGIPDISGKISKISPI